MIWSTVNSTGLAQMSCGSPISPNTALVKDGCTAVLSSTRSVAGVTGPTLAELAEPRDISMGAAYRSTFAEGDRCYRDVALAEFDSVTTEIGTMMNTVQPAPGVFDLRKPTPSPTSPFSQLHSGSYSFRRRRPIKVEVRMIGVNSR